MFIVVKRSLGALVAVAVLLLAAAPAAAIPPVHFSAVQNSVVQDQGQNCGFPVRWDIHLTVEGTRFFDRDGNLVRVQAHLKEDNTITNLDTGLTLREGPDSFMQVSYFENGALTHIVAVGLAANVQSDPKLMDVGRVVLVPLGGGRFDLVWSAGPHPVREATDLGTLADALAAFCDVLS